MTQPLFQSRLVLYDGTCNMCRQTGTVLRWLNWLRRVELRDVVSHWPALREQFPRLDYEACLRDMHVIRGDGRIDPGFDGYRSLAWVVPVFWPILPLLYVPPVRRVGWRIYRRIADRRTCAVPR